MRRPVPILVFAALALGGAAAAPAAAAPVGFAVSTPADPATASPGAVAESWLRVSNTLERPVALAVRAATVVPRDDGRMEVVDQPDPFWSGALEHPTRVDVPARGNLEVPVRVRVPADALPDVYLVGFVVEPPAATSPDQVAVRSQIATYLSVEVPGPRERRLAIAWHHVPRFVVGRTLPGRFRVENRGEATATLRGQVRVDRALGKRTNLAVVQATGDRPQLLPRGVARTVSYTWRAGGLLAFARPSVEVAYPRGAARMDTLTAPGPTVVVVPTETLAGAGALLLAGGALAARRLRRRRSSRAAEAGSVERA